MSRIYDNWERLVAAVLKREELWQLFHQNSRNTSFSSVSSDFTLSFRSSDVNLEESREKSIQKPVSLNGVRLTGTWNFIEELGKGTFGTTMLTELKKAVKVSDQEFLAKGTKVVIKLMNHARVTREEFKQKIEVLGNCSRHENVATPKAYYFSNEPNTTFVIYDYDSRGSVSDMLHNILVKRPERQDALGYHAQTYDFKNASQENKSSQENDIYNFGILLLELITGKSPMEANGFEKDLVLETWVRSIKPKEWTSKLFDQSLRKPIRDKRDVIEMIRTEIPDVDLIFDDPAMDWEILRAIVRPHFPVHDWMEMVEMLGIAMKCLTGFPEQTPKISYVVLMLEKYDLKYDSEYLMNLVEAEDGWLVVEGCARWLLAFTGWKLAGSCGGDLK
ncbi:hypothetical protein BUALT_Bualt06G0096200 [Buddleja alternifolia]|uniref:Protein kinase domain-containing protein n=1 Tax=Buddleja alternifolia TaxID=168488 RepID=A0AAV6XLP7_9LAMI|nr:hypothetical protein BUALT_Bualt06G0096200 [Buddleja alternifolia]